MLPLPHHYCPACPAFAAAASATRAAPAAWRSSAASAAAAAAAAASASALATMPSHAKNSSGYWWPYRRTCERQWLQGHVPAATLSAMGMIPAPTITSLVAEPVSAWMVHVWRAACGRESAECRAAAPQQRVQGPAASRRWARALERAAVRARAGARGKRTCWHVEKGPVAGARGERERVRGCDVSEGARAWRLRRLRVRRWQGTRKHTQKHAPALLCASL